MASQLTIERAHQALPHLVECAQRGETITYGDLGAKIGIHPRAVSHPLYYIRDEICIPRGLPLLTAIVVHKSDQLPGASWQPAGTGDNRAFEEACAQVFAYQEWPSLLYELGLSPVSEKENPGLRQLDELVTLDLSDQEESDTEAPCDIETPVAKLVLAEYDRATALERVRLEFMEKVLQTYVTLASIVVAAVLLIAEKGDEMGVSATMAEALLVGLLAFGIITLYRTVNSNVALLELAKRLRALRQCFGEAEALRKYFLVGLIDDDKRLESWAGWKSILHRGVSSGGSKGYLAIVVLLNGLCAGAIAISVLARLSQSSLLSPPNLIVGIVMFAALALAQVFYVSHRYERATATIDSQSLEWFI